MRNHLIALVAGLVLLLAAGAGTAMAQTPVQAADQSAGSTQSASSTATSTQTNPTNRNVDVRIFSPGDNGAVSQSNTSSAASAAGNANQTVQNAAQSQGGGGQAASQSADSTQTADSTATSVQNNPSNSNTVVRIDSPGNDGPVTQTNDSQAESAAGNANETAQNAGQSQGGGGNGGGVQAADQDADNEQSASSSASSTQDNPSNSNVSVRINSGGDGGAVEQRNSSGAASAAGNANATEQDADQEQGGGGHGGGGVQAADQSADNEQSADSSASSTQTDPSNSNVGVRIDSPGDDGDVSQSNESFAGSAAGNLNLTGQEVEQGYGPVAATVAAASRPLARTRTTSSPPRPRRPPTQDGATNSNIPVRIGSPGDGGDVSQSNESFAGSLAGNVNLTGQEVEQGYGSGGGNGGGGVQAVGQEADNEQYAASEATSTQDGATNSNIPVRIDSPGDDGDVSQSNESFAGSLAGNLNLTGQEVDQDYGGGGNGGGGVQAVGQLAFNDQSAESDATSTQTGATNSNTPVRIGSEGDDGDVTQTNASAALSAALNANLTDQSVAQEYSGGGGVQAVGQLADSAQDATSSATSEQEDPTNENAPVRIGSDGGGGDVEQTNASLAASLAANANETDQDATQLLSGDGGYAGVQALGQLAFNDQAAGSAATSSQSGATNAAGGVSIAGPGGGGSLTQTNASVALSAALNLNRLFQAATQRG